MPVLIGTSGWQYRDWRGVLYPDGVAQRRWLECYANQYATVENNGAFYRLPSEQTFADWRARTPEGFVMAVKASRYLTHIKRLTELGQGVARFYERIEPLVEAGRLGPVLWQLPGNFVRDDERLHGWLEALPDGLHTIEFRHPSWFAPPVMRALRERGVALTIGDHPQRPFQTHAATADWRFVRFHYGSRGRGGNYSATELEQWARRIAQWRRRQAVWAYFNNDWGALAPANAAVLARRLGVGPGRGGT